MKTRDLRLEAATFAQAAGAPDLAIRMMKDTVSSIERPRVLSSAARYLAASPKTIADYPAARSPGGPNDYYSEADYWWPDPTDPDKPYYRRDGYSNPAKFSAHRDAVIGLSIQLPALAAAWKLTRDDRYADHAERHMHAWFVAPESRMNPHLEYGQAVIGVNTGRGTGIIDTLHLVEVARAISVLRSSQRVPRFYESVTGWFADYLVWMSTSEKGLKERDQINNHCSSWALQVAAFANLTANVSLLRLARQRFEKAVRSQIAPDGSQALELARTKPFAYCLFNLDLLAAAANLLQGHADESLWRFKRDGGCLIDALDHMRPFIADKSLWPYAPDAENFEDWPVRQISLLFGALESRRPDDLALWVTLNPDPVADEVIRNFPIRQPLLWLDP